MAWLLAALAAWGVPFTIADATGITNQHATSTTPMAPHYPTKAPRSMLDRSKARALVRLRSVVERLGADRFSIVSAVTGGVDEYHVRLVSGETEVTETRTILLSWRTRGWLRENRSPNGDKHYTITPAFRRACEESDDRARP